MTIYNIFPVKNKLLNCQQSLHYIASHYLHSLPEFISISFSWRLAQGCDCVAEVAADLRLQFCYEVLQRQHCIQLWLLRCQFIIISAIALDCDTLKLYIFASMSNVTNFVMLHRHCHYHHYQFISIIHNVMRLSYNGFI